MKKATTIQTANMSSVYVWLWANQMSPADLWEYASRVSTDASSWLASLWALASIGSSQNGVDRPYAVRIHLGTRTVTFEPDNGVQFAKAVRAAYLTGYYRAIPARTELIQY